MVISSILTLSLNAVKPVELPKHLQQQTAIEEKAKNSLLQVPSNTAHETDTEGTTPPSDDTKPGDGRREFAFVLDAQKSKEIFDSFLEGLVSGADKPKPPSNTAGTPTPSDDPERGDGRREN